MVNTQVSLSDEEYVLAKSEADRLGIPLAEWLHRAIRATLPISEEPPWMYYAGMVASGDPEASRHIDEIVYGAKD